jgi:hypothetical protein
MNLRETSVAGAMMLLERIFPQVPELARIIKDTRQTKKIRNRLRLLRQNLREKGIRDSTNTQQQPVI